MLRRWPGEEISAACAFLLAGATLLSLHSRAGRIACATLGVVLTIAVIAAMAIGIRATQTPAWLQTAASIALLAGVVLYGAALARLKALPHPWLQNLTAPRRAPARRDGGGPRPGPVAPV